MNKLIGLICISTYILHKNYYFLVITYKLMVKQFSKYRMFNHCSLINYVGQSSWSSKILKY